MIGEGKVVRVGEALPDVVRKRLLALLGNFVDVFAWSVADMTGISRRIVEHKLSISPDVKPVQQRKRRQSEERRVAIREEVRKLLEAAIIRKIQFPDWLANPVMVPKPD